jgi:hypothetical protein
MPIATEVRMAQDLVGTSDVDRYSKIDRDLIELESVMQNTGLCS